MVQALPQYMYGITVKCAMCAKYSYSMPTVIVQDILLRMLHSAFICLFIEGRSSERGCVSESKILLSINRLVVNKEI